MGLAAPCFYSKQVFGPRTAKSQPMWITLTLHTHLSLYGIHLWADLDSDGNKANIIKTKAKAEAMASRPRPKTFAVIIDMAVIAV